MFELTDSDTMERVRAWVAELQALVGPDTVLTALCLARRCWCLT